MKNPIVFLTLICVATLAQPLSGQRSHIGFMGGLTGSDFSSDDVDTTGQSSFHVGIFADIPVSGSFSIQPEILYSEKGAKLIDVGEIATVEIELAYLEIPLLAKFSFPNEGTTRGHILVGPVIAFETSCEVSATLLTVGGRVPCPNFEIENDPILTVDTDFGIKVGGGIEFDLDGKALFIDATVNAGLKNINSIPANNDDVKNIALELSAGFGFPVGG